MNPISIQRVWLAVALVQLAFALTVMGETQNSSVYFELKSFLGITFAENTPDAIVALWGILFLSMLLTISLNLIAEHARVEGTSWLTRFPLRVFDFDAGSTIGKWFTYGGVLFGLFVPVWALSHSWRVMHNEATLCATGGEALVEVGRGGLPLWTIPDGASLGSLLADGYRLDGEAGCSTQATTFFPLVEPVIFLLLTIWALWSLGRAGRAVFNGEDRD